MSDIQAVIFDVGGVLLRTESQAPRRQWEVRLGLEQGQLEAIVLNSDQGHAAQRGEITEDAHWQWVGRHFGLKLADLTQLRHDFWAGDAVDRSLIHYVDELRPAYQTAIISNAMDGLRQVLHEPYQIAPAFDLIVVSAEEGIMKPNAGIFERTLHRLGRIAAETVFIDDFAHNVAGAKAVGMAAIHYTPGLDLPHQLALLGIRGPE